MNKSITHVLVGLSFGLLCTVLTGCGHHSNSAHAQQTTQAEQAPAQQAQSPDAAEARPHHPVPQYPDIAYTDKPGSPNQKLDIYLPSEKSDKPLPLIIFVHGGGWYEGDRKHPGLTAQFLKDGFAVSSIDYRLTNEAIFPAQIYDVKAAIRYLRANAAKYNIDPDKIGLFGMSAGGHLVALAGTAGDAKELEGSEGNNGVSSRVQAVVDWFGPTDFTDYANGKEKLGKNVEWMVERFLGGKVTDKKEEAKASSPITYVTSDDPTTLIMHGTKDALVPLAQSEVFAKALEKAGVPCKLEVIQGAGHEMFAPEYRDEVVQFFEKNLKASK